MADQSDVDREYEEYKKQGRLWGQVPRERIRKIKYPRVPPDIVREFMEMQDLTTTVSDVLDSLGVRAAVAGSFLKPLIPGKKLVGTATTVRSIPERKTPTKGYYDKDTIKMSTRESYYLAEPGDVFVADFGGNLDTSNMGGQSCTVAKSRGLAGAIVNGAVRDVSAIVALDYPVWSVGVTPMTGKFRMEAVELNGPVTVHDVAVYPGDLVCADDSGVCFIPAEHVETVLKQAQSIHQEEAHMRTLIEGKASVSELLPFYRKRYK